MTLMRQMPLQRQVFRCPLLSLPRGQALELAAPMDQHMGTVGATDGGSPTLALWGSGIGVPAHLVPYDGGGGALTMVRRVWRRLGISILRRGY